MINKMFKHTFQAISTHFQPLCRFDFERNFFYPSAFPETLSPRSYVTKALMEIPSCSCNMELLKGNANGEGAGDAAVAADVAGVQVEC